MQVISIKIWKNENDDAKHFITKDIGNAYNQDVRSFKEKCYWKLFTVRSYLLF